MDGDETEGQPGYSGVLIERTISDDGSKVEVSVKTVGDVRLTEVAEILRMGRAKWKRSTRAG
jgi:hypothetical protein